MRTISQKLQRLRWRLSFWLENHLPHYCPICGQWTIHKHTRLAMTTWGRWVRMCRVCYQTLYPDEVQL